MVQARPLQPQAAQAHVDGLLGLVAPAHHLEQEAAGVAFLEGVDDFGAACSERLVAHCLVQGGVEGDGLLFAGSWSGGCMVSGALWGCGCSKEWLLRLAAKNCREPA